MPTLDQYANCVIAVRGRWQILGARDDFKWAAGNVGLYRVAGFGAGDAAGTFLRATRGGDGVWHVFDLRRLSPEFAHDWVRAERTERHATLRSLFESPAAFIRWAEAQDAASPVLTAAEQQPARRDHGAPLDAPPPPRDGDSRSAA